ncbi:MAG: hypothetical protein ACOX83_00375 [Candidatus Spyradocola sp.]
MKRIVTRLLLLTLLLAMAVVPGYAQTAMPAAEWVGESQLDFDVQDADDLLAEPVKAPRSAQGEPAAEWVGESQMPFAETPEDSRTELVTKGSHPPNAFWNLGADAYTAHAGSMTQEVHTDSYFCPNADGEIYVSASFGWLDLEEGASTNRSVTILLCEYGGSIWEDPELVSHQTEGYADENGRLSTGRIRFYNLDPNAFYSFAFRKTPDPMPAELWADISHDGFMGEKGPAHSDR